MRCILLLCAPIELHFDQVHLYQLASFEWNCLYRRVHNNSNGIRYHISQLWCWCLFLIRVQLIHLGYHGHKLYCFQGFDHWLSGIFYLQPVIILGLLCVRYKFSHLSLWL